MPIKTMVSKGRFFYRKLLVFY